MPTQLPHWEPHGQVPSPSRSCQSPTVSRANVLRASRTESVAQLRPVRSTKSHPLSDPSLLDKFADGTQGLPLLWRMAFAATNHLRKAAGFEDLHVYSTDWSEKGFAHAQYYCGTGYPGHFELQERGPDGRRWFSEAGNSAAGCSGISYGGRSPLDTFFAMLEGPFHRRQFMHCAATAMGVSYHRDNGRMCGLFPCKPLETTSWSWPQRFHVWPPEGYQLCPGAFHGETPDPRPPVLIGHEHTGLIASIAFTQVEDVASFQALVTVHFVDLVTGKDVDCWTRDPAHPPRVSDEVWYGLYGEDKPDGPNHLETLTEVWIGAMHPLEPGHDYAIRVSMQFTGEAQEVIVEWEFGIAPPIEHHVSPESQLEFELSLYTCGRSDIITLGPGSFLLPEIWWYGEPRELIGAGPGLTHVVYGMSEGVGNGTIASDLALRHMTLVNDEHESFFWVMGRATVVLEAVHIHARGVARRFNVAEGGELLLLACDLQSYHADEVYLAYLQYGAHLQCKACPEAKGGELWAYRSVGKEPQSDTEAFKLAGASSVATTPMAISLKVLRAADSNKHFITHLINKALSKL